MALTLSGARRRSEAYDGKGFVCIVDPAFDQRVVFPVNCTLFVRSYYEKKSRLTLTTRPVLFSYTNFLLQFTTGDPR